MAGGLLDFLMQDPSAQLGIGLLAAGGPTTDPNQTGFGQRLAAARNSVTAQQGAQLDLKMKQAQMDQLGFALKKNQFLYDMASKAMNPDQNGAFPSQGPQSPVPSGGPVGGMSGAPGGAPTGAPMGAPQGPQAPQIPQGGGAPGGNMFGNIPRNVAAFSMLTDPNALNTAMLAQYAPTDFEKMLRAANIEPSSPLGRQMIQQNIAKQNYTAPVNARPGSILRDPFTNQPVAFNPHVPDNSSPVFDASGNVVAMKPIAGADAAISAVEQARATGKGNIETKQVWDPNYTDPATGRKGGFVNQTVSNIAGAANPVTPMAGGTGNVQSPGYTGGDRNTANAESIRVMQDELKNPALSPGDRAGITREIQRMQMQSGLTNAQVAQAPQAGPMAAQPPLGDTSNADAAQKASAQTMHDSYSKLQSANSTANAALDALNKMQELAAKKNPVLTAGPLGTLQTPLNADAAEYEKQQANVITLLSNQNGSNTDASRATTGKSVPDFGRPKAAIKDGLETLKNQTVAQQLKTNLLTPVYQSGDSKAYTKLENEFDQNVSPSMVPVLTMPPGQSRAMLLQSLRKQPGMEAKLNWAAERGLLK